MISVPLLDDVSGFAPDAILIGEGSRGDRIWTRDQFIRLCELMRNDNPPDEFLHAYCDPSGAPRFVKAKSPNVEKRITWSWDTITGRAKHNVAIGFYPSNARGQLSSGESCARCFLFSWLRLCAALWAREQLITMNGGTMLLLSNSRRITTLRLCK